LIKRLQQVRATDEAGKAVVDVEVSLPALGEGTPVTVISFYGE
jgi:hypothetical protein